MRQKYNQQESRKVRLYNIYTSDISTPTDADIALFANDTAITATANKKFTLIDKLQKATNTTTKWITKWKIEPNSVKTQAILISKGTRPPTRHFKINNTEVN